MQTARVTGLYIYPVKSCRGIALTKMNLNQRGPEHDRQWMLVDENNQFITLRTNSKLAEIKTAFQGSFLHLYLGANKILINSTEECEQVEEVTVWKDTFKAGIENKSINEALSDFLNKTVKLVRYQTQSFRDLGAGATSVVKETMFADSRPLLLVNQNSLQDLNQQLALQNFSESEILRFRPNIIIEGLPAFAEENISEFSVQTAGGPLVLTQAKLCARCPVITQDIETGRAVSKETLKVLSEYRKKESTNKVFFGVNLTPQQTGTIELGDEVRV